MYYGVSYYPEQKTPEELDHDLALIIESGINVVRMGEFAWCRMEPEEGVFEFGWLESVVNRLGEAGIQSLLCTPTACPPIWITEKYPDMMYVDNRGRTRPFGGRRHYCYSHIDYRQHCEVIADRLGKFFGRNPHVLGFQIDNEPAQESTGRCRCPRCRQSFQQWLHRKYGTIERLNRAMGTVFWSQEYSRFGQISPPTNTTEVGTDEPIFAFFDNPSLHLDFERFSSDAQIDFQNVQLDSLRRHTGKTIMTNGTGTATNSINYYRSYKHLDVYAFDYYPNLREGAVSSFPYAFGRGVKGNDFWLAEFSSGGGHGLRGAGRLQPFPGALEQSVVHAFASGASLLCHFQFRTFPYGAEQLNYAIVDADGIPRRHYRDMVRTAEVLGELEGLLESSERNNSIGIVFDYDSLWAHKIKAVQQETFDYSTFVQEFYQELVFQGYGMDVISPDSDFSQYEVLILPALIICDQDLIEQVRDFVDRGGTVIATFLTSVKNGCNVATIDSLPGGLGDVFGITVIEPEPVFRNTGELVCFSDGRRFPNRHWAEILVPGNAVPIAEYTRSFKKGACAVSRNSYGKGHGYYFGTGFLSDEMAERISLLLQEQGCSKVPFSWNGLVECLSLDTPDGKLFFLFNFQNDIQSISGPEGLVDVLTGESLDACIRLPARGWRVVR